MKKLKIEVSKLDIIILSIVFVLGICTKVLYDYLNGLNAKDYSIENLQLIKQMDSLELVVHQRDIQINSMDTLIRSIKERQIKTDSLIIKNSSKLKNEKNKYDKLSPDDRIKYVDSLLKVAGVRK